MRLPNAEAFFARATGWWTVFAALCLLLLAPLLFADIPPILDYPNHLARLFVLSQAGRDPVLGAIWQPHWAVIPDLAMDLIGPPLMRVMSPFDAGKIILALALLAPLAGVIAFSRAAFGTRLYWPMTAGLMAYNLIFILGFINYLIALGAALMAGALWLRLRARPTIIRFLVGAACACAIFFMHLLGVALFGLLAGASEAEHLLADRRAPGAWKRIFGAASLLAAIMFCPFVLWMLSPARGPDSPDLYWSFVSKLFFLPSPFEAYGSLPGLVIAGVFAWVTISWIAKRQCGLASGAAVVIAALVLAIIAVPLCMAGGAYVDSRIPLMLTLVLAASIRPPRAPVWLGRAAAVAVCGALILEVVQICGVWRGYQAEVASLREIILPVTPGSRVLTVSTAIDPNAAYWRRPPPGVLALGVLRTDHHLPALLAIDRRAFWPLLFSDPSQHPIEVQPAYAGLVGVNLPTGLDSVAAERSLDPNADAPYLENWPAHFDFVLVIDAGVADDLDHFLPDKLRLLSRSKFAALFRVRKSVSAALR
jgi:hypothetical protein